MSSFNLQDAIRRSIQTEKNAMDFYRQAARQARNEDARKVFELLAREEREHAHWFYDIYPGKDLPDFDRLIGADPDQQSDWLSDLTKAELAALNERRALELAMEKEQALEKHLREMAARIEDAAVRKVFEDNARSTHNHYLLIESEYARLMGMVHETDIDTYVRE